MITEGIAAKTNNELSLETKKKKLYAARIASSEGLG